MRDPKYLSIDGINKTSIRIGTRKNNISLKSDFGRLKVKDSKSSFPYTLQPSTYVVDYNPTVSNDSIDSAVVGTSFKVGDLWLNDVAELLFVCMDDTPNEALWKTINPLFFYSAAEASAFKGSDGDVCYVKETNTTYRYVESADTVIFDNVYVIKAAFNSYWEAVSGKYLKGTKHYKDSAYFHNSIIVGDVLEEAVDVDQSLYVGKKVQSQNVTIIPKEGSESFVVLDNEGDQILSVSDAGMIRVGVNKDTVHYTKAVNHKYKYATHLKYSAGKNEVTGEYKEFDTGSKEDVVGSHLRFFPKKSTEGIIQKITLSDEGSVADSYLVGSYYTRDEEGAAEATAILIDSSYSSALKVVTSYDGKPLFAVSGKGYLSLNHGVGVNSISDNMRLEKNEHSSLITKGLVRDFFNKLSESKENKVNRNTAFNKDFGTSFECVARGDHLHTGVYEPVFDKCTAFNRDFGTQYFEVSRGDHTHVGEYEPAFSELFYDKLPKNCVWDYGKKLSLGDTLHLSDNFSTIQTDILDVTVDKVNFREGVSFDFYTFEEDDDNTTQKKTYNNISSLIVDGQGCYELSTWNNKELNKLLTLKGNRVGINTTNPTSDLEITGVHPSVVMNSGNSNATIMFKHEDSVNKLYSRNDSFNIYNKSFVVSVKDRGLGVGTQQPTNKLHLNSEETKCGIALTNDNSENNKGTFFGFRRNGNVSLWNYHNSDFTLGTNNSELLRVSSNGCIITNGGSSYDTSKGGITFTQESGGNVLSFQNNNIGVRIPNVVNTTYGSVGMLDEEEGGIVLKGNSSDKTGVSLRSYVERTGNTVSSNAVGCMEFVADKSNGSSWGKFDADDNLFVFKSSEDARVIFKATGEIYSDYGSAVAMYDSEDDLSLTRALQQKIGGIKLPKVYRDKLCALGIMTENGFISNQKKDALILGSIYQLFVGFQRFTEKFGLSDSEFEELLKLTP